MIQNNKSELNIVDFLVIKGEGWNDSVEVTNQDDTPFDFTGYTAIAEIRKRVNGAVFQTVQTSDNTIVLTEGLVTFDAVIDLQPSSYMYSLKIFSGEEPPLTIFSGAINVIP